MKDRPLFGRYFAPDETGGGGAGDEEIATTEEEAVEAESEETSPEPEEGAGPEAKPEDDPEALKAEIARLKAENEALEAKEPEREPEKQPEPGSTLTPIQQARKELDDKGIYYTEDELQDRADEIREERMGKMLLEGQKPMLIESNLGVFKHPTIPDPKPVAKDYVDVLAGFGPKAFENTDFAKKAQATAYIQALGYQKLRELQGYKEPEKEPEKEPDADPIGNLPQKGYSKDVKEFLTNWGKAHNGGKFPDAKQVDNLKKEFPAVFE